MHALNRKQRRTFLSFVRRRKWGQLAPMIGVEKTLEVMARVAAMPNAQRKKIGRSV